MKFLRIVVAFALMVMFVSPLNVNAKKEGKTNNSIHNRMEDLPEQSNSSLKEEKTHPEQSEAIFTRDYEVTTFGADGIGQVDIQDDNDVFDYTLTEDVNLTLSNEDTFTVDVVNKGGNTTKVFTFEASGLIDPFDGFEIQFEGIDGFGTVLLLDNNQYVEYEADESTGLSNGDVVTVFALSEGSPFASSTYNVTGLMTTWDTLELSVSGLNAFGLLSVVENNPYVDYVPSAGMDLSNGQILQIDAVLEGNVIDTMPYLVEGLVENFDAFSIEFETYHTIGNAVITETNEFVYYEADYDMDTLSNGDTIVVTAYKQNDNSYLEEREFTVEGLIDLFSSLTVNFSGENGAGTVEILDGLVGYTYELEVGYEPPYSNGDTVIINAFLEDELLLGMTYTVEGLTE